MSLLITEGDNPKQVRQDEQTALSDLKRDGCNVEVGPSTPYAEAPDQPGREAWGYVLTRNVH